MTMYAVLALEDEAMWEQYTPEQRAEAEEPYGAYTRMLTAGGHNRGWQVLEPVAASATVRVRDGRTVVTDGPFTEAKEVLGGFYLIEAADMDEAIALAAQCPSASAGAVQVRPIMYSSTDS